MGSVTAHVSGVLNVNAKRSHKKTAWCLVHTRLSRVRNTHRLVFNSEAGLYGKSVFHRTLQSIQRLISDGLL